MDMSVRTKKTVAATRRKAIAYHEAGHAVAAHRLGYEVMRVSIAPKSGSAGHVSWRNPIKNRSVISKLEYGSEADLDRVRHRIDHAIIVSMAGALAQKRHNPRSDWRYGGSGVARDDRFLLKGSDDQQALQLASQLHENEKVRAAYWRYLKARAEALVNHHWPEIEQLARALLHRETISGDDIHEAMMTDAIRKALAKAQASISALGRGNANQ
jgi:hypothetical protein